MQLKIAPAIKLQLKVASTVKLQLKILATQNCTTKLHSKLSSAQNYRYAVLYKIATYKIADA